METFKVYENDEAILCIIPKGNHRTYYVKDGWTTETAIRDFWDQEKNSLANAYLKLTFSEV